MNRLFNPLFEDEANIPYSPTPNGQVIKSYESEVTGSSVSVGGVLWMAPSSSLMDGPIRLTLTTVGKRGRRTAFGWSTMSQVRLTMLLNSCGRSA